MRATVAPPDNGILLGKGDYDFFVIWGVGVLHFEILGFWDLGFCWFMRDLVIWGFGILYFGVLGFWDSPCPRKQPGPLWSGPKQR